jgi:DNA repair protein RadC
MKRPDEGRQLRRLHDALSAYVDLRELRRLAGSPDALHEALRVPEPPREVLALLDTLKALLMPTERTQIRSPTDAAGVLSLEMAHLDQEHLRTVLLDTKNRVQGIATIYIGSVNTAMVRVGEVYKEAVRRNSTAIIVAHNHPSGDPTPSPEDIMVTKQIVEAGKLLDIECLDHLVIGKGRYVSMRERGLGF